MPSSPCRNCSALRSATQAASLRDACARSPSRRRTTPRGSRILIVRTADGERHAARGRPDVLRRHRPRAGTTPTPGAVHAPSTACCCSSATCSISRSSTSTAARSCASTTSSSTRTRSTATSSSTCVAVDVGARGAVRRLVKGVVPSFTLRALLERIPPRVIPWQYVDLHRDRPGPAREAEDRLRGALEACTPPTSRTSSRTCRRPSRRPSSRRSTRKWRPKRSRRSIPTSRCRLSSRSTANRAADIVEEMDPDAAADLLGDLTAGPFRRNSPGDGAGGAAGSHASSSSSASTPPPAA